MSYQVPFGDDELLFTLPDKWSVALVSSDQESRSPLSIAQIENRLTNFAHTIAKTADPQQPIWAVFTDATRASPDQTLLEPIARVLQDAGFSIKFMCALGMHRPSTQDEKLAKLGQWIVSNFDVLDHDPSTVIQLDTIDGVPLEINPFVLNATVISVGVVEPHQYAGYSGGTKTVVIGCGGPNTISKTHGPEFLNMSGTRLGRVQNNPFQNFLRKAGARIGHQYAVNAVMGDNGEILALETGKPDHVHDSLVNFARNLFECPVPNAPYDVVITGVGAPKDANLYQASRAATYIGLSGDPVIRAGGVIIVPVPLPENGGQGIGEINTLETLRRFGPTQALIDHLLKNGCRPGEQRAFMIAQLLQHYQMILVGVQNPDFLADTGLIYAPDMNTATGIAETMLQTTSPRTLIVPHALKTIPVPTTS